MVIGHCVNTEDSISIICFEMLNGKNFNIVCCGSSIYHQRKRRRSNYMAPIKSNGKLFMPGVVEELKADTPIGAFYNCGIRPKDLRSTKKREQNKANKSSFYHIAIWLLQSIPLESGFKMKDIYGPSILLH